MPSRKNPATDPPAAAVLGLGLIGSRVAARLVAAGFATSVWNRTPREFPGLPAPAPTPSEAARAAGVIQIFVSDDDALRETVRAILPVLGPGCTVLSHATVSPRTVRGLADEAAARGAAFLDAPFTGSRDAAAQGQITYYVGGDPDALEHARPVLAASARAIIPSGPVGQASAVKIATNIIAAAAAASLAEAVNLLRAEGVDPRVLTEALATNAARSGVTDLKLPCMLDGDFAPRFSVRNMLKDMRLAKELAPGGAGSLTAALESLYARTCEAGHGDDDFAAVVTLAAPQSAAS